jgi:hypothetical protein
MFKHRIYIQNCWVFGLFPSSGVLGTRKHDVSGTGSVFVLWGGETPTTQYGPLDRANLNHCPACQIRTAI